MELVLTSSERAILKKALESRSKSGPVVSGQLLGLLAGGLLTICPLVFIMANMSNIDQVIRTVGMYLTIMVSVGVILCFCSGLFGLQARTQKEQHVLYSAIKKVVESTGISIE
jgi:hypothetical protein